ncbi:uncharacterized protein VTP21DRAFT_9203 [Calcarisporiella thermophila]|uniref:uncharacterized protein n=1 Tax=Calcarisporiella thermophila TaxID=911321 RepID=UPI003742F7CD
MFLYNLTLEPSAAISQAILGNFSGTKQQEIIVSHQSSLELLRPDPNTGKVHHVLAHEVFGIIRSLSPFRLTGGSKDYIIVGSDSGRIVILEYNPEKNQFDKVHQETYGKTGCRRLVPGQYLATDPKGRAVMIGAIEKQKLVYVLNRDSAANLTISSPLEAHKSYTLVHHLVGVDVGFENPLFACIEIDYSDVDQDSTGEAFQNMEKLLTYYELDLGLNHVVRKWSDAIDKRSNMLFAVPGGNDGPSGVLVCSEGYITYRHQDVPEHRVPIPRRNAPLDGSQRGLMIVSGAILKMKGVFFFLLQSELGDLYKVSIDYEKGQVTNLRIKYFDTVPVASSLCVLKSGFLFVASEYGNHQTYQFVSLGDDNEDTEYNSVDFMSDDIQSSDLPSVFIHPRAPKNLYLVDERESLSPLLDLKVHNLTDEDTPQMYALCGRGSRSTFRVLRHGLEVTEVASSELPGKPNAIWTTKLRSTDQFDSYIVVSFLDQTLVLSIGESAEEVTDSGFTQDAPTLAVQQLGDDALVQVYPHGVRHIRADGRVNEWKTPSNRTIVRASTNTRQVVIALSSAEIVYFELDNLGQLNEFQERKDMAMGVTSLSVGVVPEGRQRSKFLAVGCEDLTVRIFSLDPESCMEQLSVQAVNAVPTSLCIAEMMDQPGLAIGTTYLSIGLQNGVMLRSVLDDITGGLSETRTRFLGARAIKLHHVKIQGNPAVLALSTQPWLIYTFQGRLHTTPLTYHALEFASGFSSEEHSEGIVAISGDTLSILTLEKLGTVLSQSSIPLKYTPRRMLLHPDTRNFVIIESDHNTYSSDELRRIRGDDVVDGEAEEIPPEIIGLPRAPAGRWGSCIRILNPLQGETVSMLELEGNEAAFSMAIVQFQSQGGEAFLVVGTAKDLILAPRSFSAAYIHIYRFTEEGKTIELLHKTQVEDIPLAFVGFQGRLLAGVGKLLRIYDVGKRKLLRKCECKSIPTCIVALHTQGNRIVAADIQESMHFAVYRHAENRIHVFADDTTPRWMTASVMLDYETVAGGDKFGNVFVDRLPPGLSEQMEDTTLGGNFSVQKSYLNGAPNRLQNLVHFHVGDIVTSIQRATLVPGGREVLVCATHLGSIRVVIPFATREDVDFFQTLEMHVRQETASLIGRDQLAYRSYYVPVKGAVDGDLVELYNLLPPEKRRAIAVEMDRTTGEIQKKVEDMRVRAAF